jgi:lysyl-tRNA synthetase class 2
LKAAIFLPFFLNFVGYSIMNNKIELLKDRALMLALARGFFEEKGVLEVDCPSLSACPSIDIHIDLIPAFYVGSQKRFLHSSPEYGMKRLLSLGIGDCYQLSHVFRDGECGELHNPEFMMAEWYRVGTSFQGMIEETVDFISLFLGRVSVKFISYREALREYIAVDYLTATCDDLVLCLEERGFSMNSDLSLEDKDSLLNLLMGHYVEPHFEGEILWVLTHYPASQAALANTIMKGDEQVAERFEIYFKGVELANGYHELTDAVEQRKRFEEANDKREIMGKVRLDSDGRFLQALEVGLPDSCGVAVGFDRLMMLRHDTPRIGDIMPFPWEEA